jgi:hypothetical protein
MSLMQTLLTKIGNKRAEIAAAEAEILALKNQVLGLREAIVVLDEKAQKHRKAEKGR